MTPSEFLKTYDGCINRFGLVNPEGGESENDVRFTCEAELAAELNGVYASDFRLALSWCMDQRTGVLKINPENDNQNSMDNYIPLFYTARGTPLAQTLLDHGMKNWWWYKNKNQDESIISPYMGKFAAFRAMAKMSTLGQKLNCLDIQLYRAALEWALKNTGSDQDGRCLTTFLFKMGAGHPWMGRQEWFRWLKIRWMEDFERNWPNGYGQVLEKYHGHPTPTSKLLMGYFG